MPGVAWAYQGPAGGGSLGRHMGTNPWMPRQPLEGRQMIGALNQQGSL